MILPGLSIAAFVFAATLILSFRPDRMGHVRRYRSPLSQLRWAVSICQDAAFGRPVLTLCPNRCQVTMRLDFVDEARVFVRVPLIFKKQLADQDRLKALLGTYGEDVVANAPNGQTVYLTAVLDRTNSDLSTRVEGLYAAMFDIGDRDVTNIEVETLAMDGARLETLYKGLGKPTRDEPMKSLSRRHAGKAPRATLRDRLLLAADIFLYPPMILATYALAGIVGVAWAILLIVAFYVIKGLSEGKPDKVLRKHLLGIVMAVFAGMTIATGEVVYLQYLPMVMGAGFCWMMAKRNEKWDDKPSPPGGASFEFWFEVLFLFIGVGIILAGLWARASLGLDEWVRFYAFLRLELIVATMTLMIPTVLLIIAFFSDSEDSSRT